MKDKILKEFEEKFTPALYLSLPEDTAKSALNGIKNFLSQAIDKTREETIRDMEEKLNETYTKIEKDQPPQSLNNVEANYNEGFFRGQLRAMEIVVRDLTGKNGDELK